MTSTNFKVIGLTRPGFECMRSRFEPARFGFPDFPEREAGTLLIQPTRLVCGGSDGGMGVLVGELLGSGDQV